MGKVAERKRVRMRENLMPDFSLISLLRRQLPPREAKKEYLNFK